MNNVILIGAVILLLGSSVASLGRNSRGELTGIGNVAWDEFELIVDDAFEAYGNKELVNEIKSQLSLLEVKTRPLMERLEKEGAMLQGDTFVEEDVKDFQKKTAVRVLATDGLTSDDDEVYNNPDDNYKPSSNVENGAAISGVDFDTTADYLSTVLVKPILLFCLGFVSLFGLNLGLCCRCLCTCCSCAPKKDITEIELSHQKLMITGIEILLIFSVLLADTLCFYGYTSLQDGVDKLNDAFDGLLVIFTNVKSICYLLYMQDAPQMTTSTNAAKITCSNALSILSEMDTFNAALNSAAKLLYDAIVLLVNYMDTGKEIVNNYVDAYLRTFVFIIWAFAAMATFWFVLFRIFKSECGTKFAIFWGELTFFLILLFNVPMMILAQVLGDFCVQPTHNIIKATPDGDLEDMVRFYSHCTGNDTIGERLLAVQDALGDISNATSTIMLHPSFGCSSDSNLLTIVATISTVGDRFGDIRSALTCVNFQAVWFTLMNDSFCGGIYSGIYSLWVSQFITSFFLFFLIVCASISYQYFHPDHVTKIVPVDEEPVESIKMASAQYADTVDAPIEKGGGGDGSSYGEESGGKRGEIEMSEMAGNIDGEDII